MKLRPTLLSALLPATLLAVDGTWIGPVNQVDNGSWNDAANWGGVIPGGAGSTITFPNAQENGQRASTTVDVPFTVGTLNIGLGSKNWTFNAGENGSLTFDNGGQPGIINGSSGARGVDIKVPLAGTHGITVTGTSKAFVSFSGDNTYSGETRIMSPFLRILNNGAIGNTSRYRLTSTSNAEVFLYVGTGVTLNKDIYLEGQSGSRQSAHLGFVYVANADAVVSGNIYCASPSGGGGAQIFAEDLGSYSAVINGDIFPVSDEIPSNLGLRGDAGRCVINGAINLPNGTLTKNGLATYVLSHPDNHWTGNTVIFNGTLVMGATHAYSYGAPLEMSEWGTGGTFDLHGFDQTIGPLVKCGNPTGPHRITSEDPAVLTMLVTDNSGNNSTSKGWVLVDGALTLRKTGSGTQTFWQKPNTGDTTLLHTGGTEVLEGTLVLNNTLTKANITVDGGVLSGNTTLRYSATAPETLTVKSGSANLASMAITFEPGEVPLGRYLVVDYSGTGTLEGADGSEVYPFASCDGLPADCRWVHRADEKKVYLVHPLDATMIMLR